MFNLLEKIKGWIQKHHLVDLNITFNDAIHFHEIVTAEFPSGTSLDFGSFSWKPELTDIIGGRHTPSDVCMMIEMEFEKRTGISIWQEADICRRIRRVLESGKSNSVGFLWGLTYYRINIKFLNEK